MATVARSNSIISSTAATRVIYPFSFVRRARADFPIAACGRRRTAAAAAAAADGKKARRKLVAFTISKSFSSCEAATAVGISASPWMIFALKTVHIAVRMTTGISDFLD